MSKKNVKVVVEMNVSFESYNDKAKDGKAKNQIRKFVRDVLDDCSYIPLYVERDDDGSDIEDVTHSTRIKITECSFE
jgi:hypothetical protein